MCVLFYFIFTYISLSYITILLSTWLENILKGHTIYLLCHVLFGCCVFYLDLLIISLRNDINFYDLTNLKEPKWIGNYKISNNASYSYHGMCLLSSNDFIDSNNDNGNKKGYNINFALFGGSDQLSFSSSIMGVNVKINDINNVKNINRNDFNRMVGITCQTKNNSNFNFNDSAVKEI